MQRYSRCPQYPAGPGYPQAKRFGMAKLWNGMEADAQNERSDPAEDLSMAVCLNPCGRHRIRGAMTTNCQQVPDSEERARHQHENKASRDIYHQQTRQLDFALRCDFENLPRREGVAPSLFYLCWLCRHGWLRLMLCFHRNCSRKQNVVLQV